MGNPVRGESSHKQEHCQAGVGQTLSARPGENGEAPGAGPVEKGVLVKRATSWAVTGVSLAV